MQKKMKNGIQCNDCHSFHKIRFQELQHAYVLLLGECNTYNKLQNEINLKYVNLTQEIYVLKSKKTETPVNRVTTRKANKKNGS